jgi:hypothetical protein
MSEAMAAFPTLAEPIVIPTSDGWLPLTEQTAADLAHSAMLLACTPEHVDALRSRSAGARRSS